MHDLAADSPLVRIRRIPGVAMMLVILILCSR